MVASISTISVEMATYKMRQPQMEMNSSNNYKYLLQIENSTRAIALIPLTILFSSLLAVGIIGNFLVLYTNTFIIKRSTARVYIMCLAACDLTTCVLGLPFNSLTLIYPLTFVWDHACKTLIFLLTCTITGSIFFLILLAVERYRNVCKPLEKHFSPTKTKIACWTTVITSTVFAIPMIFVYGSRDMQTNIPNVTGKGCGKTNDYISSDVSLMYHGFLLLIFVFSVFILTGLYIKIVIVLWKRRFIHGTSWNTSVCSASATGITETTASQLQINNDKCVENNVQAINSTTAKCNSHRKNQNQEMADNSKIENELSGKRTGLLMSELISLSSDKLASGKSKSTWKNQIKMDRITAMLFLVTLIFIICFLPCLIISIMTDVNEKFWQNKSQGDIVIANLLTRTYFINTMINPIVYWFLDTNFQQALQKLFKDIKQCA